eukprot:TRINITY_DN5758_c1_g5_i1.p1 TRINITY_DN5758_c1_g5~~TRINITY_DN5758_c1_g5_i1.p1  ORF type:complete len:273 (+),score=66.19 TRINITY_DN5758_c1_g5_i1:181-999(+)
MAPRRVAVFAAALGAAAAVALLSARLTRRKRQRARAREIESRRGVIRSLWTSPGTSMPMLQHPTLQCEAGVGIVGDRYSLKLEKGRYSGSPEVGRQLTLIAEEGLDRIRQKDGLDIHPHDCRRNVVTRGIKLADLVGHEIRIGESIRLFAHRATVPCMYLEGLLRQTGLFEALYYDAGLSCEILAGGQIAEGDRVEVVPDSFAPERCVTWSCASLFVAPVDRSAEDKRAILALRGDLQAKAERDAGLKKRLRLFDQAFGRKDDTWDGGKPQW